jgi:cephalosporin hydroxylase
LSGEDDARAIVDQFHRLYYDAGVANGTWRTTRWRGVPIYKNPLDLWICQELILRIRPDLVVETGTMDGGSALYLAHLLDLAGNGRVVTIDVEDAPGPACAADPDLPRRLPHPRLTYVRGSSTDPAIVGPIGREAAGTVMVILDSDHGEAHVRRELACWAPLVTPGSYLVVEETNLHGRPVYREHGPGPGEAVDAFLATTADFEVDTSCERLFLTFNPGGYLRRRRPGEAVAAPRSPLAGIPVPDDRRLAALRADCGRLARETAALDAECERLAAESARARADLADVSARAARLDAERASLAATVATMTESRLWRVGERWWRFRATVERAARRIAPGAAYRA